MAEMDRVKQLMSGTFWLKSSSTSSEVLCQASLAVRTFLDKTPTLQRQLGWTPKPHHPRHGMTFLRILLSLLTKTRFNVAVR